MVDTTRVIEIFSSPELSPVRQPRRAATRSGSKKSAAVDDDVVDLNDSEGLDFHFSFRVPFVKSQQKVPESPVAGPSRAARAGPAHEPANNYNPPPESDDDREGDPSNKIRGKQRAKPAPAVAPPAAAHRHRYPSAPAKPSEPDTEEEVQRPSLDEYIAQVLEIIPDVEPGYARKLVERHHSTYKGQIVGQVLHMLFENPDYPKVDPKGKAKRKREEEPAQPVEAKNAKQKVDYGNKDRQVNVGLGYPMQALEQLKLDFPLIPTNYIRHQLALNNVLYAPTYLVLHEESKLENLPYKQKATTARRGRKGKTVVRLDEELEKEIEWVKLKLQGVLEDDAQAAEEPEDGIECACCFSVYPFEKMIQCPEAHLFCTDCMTSYASTKLGTHDTNIVCMDQSGCKLAFPESELRRFLSPKLLSLYERVKQQKEIDAAGLENLEECPHCEYKCVIENEQEKLFRCQNEDCMAITCRQCKKPDHLPKSCKEMDEDKKLDARHTVEEAMTRALMRNCPKCSKAFVKEMGCNKMTCPHCHTLSCYVCRKIVIGYDHFNNPPPYTNRPDPMKCPLWDSVEQRHSQEVAAAGKKAMEELKRAHPELSEKDLHVDLPPPPPADAGPSNAQAGPVPRVPGVIMGIPVPRGIQAAGEAMRMRIEALGRLQADVNRYQVYPAPPRVQLQPPPVVIPPPAHGPLPPLLPPDFAAGHVHVQVGRPFGIPPPAVAPVQVQAPAAAHVRAHAHRAARIQLARPQAARAVRAASAPARAREPRARAAKAPKRH